MNDATEFGSGHAAQAARAFEQRRFRVDGLARILEQAQLWNRFPLAEIGFGRLFFACRLRYGSVTRKAIIRILRLMLFDWNASIVCLNQLSIRIEHS